MVRLIALAVLLGYAVISVVDISSATAAPRRTAASQATASVADSFDYPVNNPRWIAGYDRKNTALTRASGCYPGKKVSDLYHSGEDWAVTSGTAVKAVANGTVVFAKPDYDYNKGNVVIIEHALPDGAKIYSMYGHLTPGALKVSVDGKDKPNIVTKGQEISTVVYQSYVDNAGKTQDNSHLHWEIRTFADGSSLCGRKDGVSPPGPGYTYPEHPDAKGYRNPAQFIKDHQGTTVAPDPNSPPAARLTRLPNIPVVKPSASATITLTIQNIGAADWPAKGTTTFNHVSGDQLAIESPQRLLRTIPSGAEATWRLEVTAPDKPGVYDGAWRMVKGGAPFGDITRIAVVVRAIASKWNHIQNLG